MRKARSSAYVLPGLQSLFIRVQRGQCTAWKVLFRRAFDLPIFPRSRTPGLRGSQWPQGSLWSWRSHGTGHVKSVCQESRQEKWNSVEKHKHTLSRKLTAHLGPFHSPVRRSFHLTRGRFIAPSGVKCLIIAVCRCVSTFKWLITNKAWCKTWCGEEYVNSPCFNLAIWFFKVWCALSTMAWPWRL